MSPIDLIDFTHSKRKIPSALLSHKPVQAIQIKSTKILAAYFLDFLTITTATMMISSILKISFSTFMVTSTLQNALANASFFGITINILPLTFMSYFFFSFFFNHGQTWGMHVMKNRITMKEMSFRSSLIWAMFSSTFMMTGGFSYLFTYNWMKNKKWGEFKGHDHLYFELMQERNLSPMCLVTYTNNVVENEAQQDEDYVKAA